MDGILFLKGTITRRVNRKAKYEGRRDLDPCVRMYYVAVLQTSKQICVFVYFFDRPVKEIVGERARRAAWRAQTTISSPFINNDLITLLSTWWVRLTTRAGLRHLKALGTGSFRGLILVWCIHVIFRIAVMFSRFSNDR